ncbi:MAG TPA: hypothetical protein VMK66_00645 [Myxococcales bacterium]|nr:hypothetical protein [Myxococcales bacterium]
MSLSEIVKNTFDSLRAQLSGLEKRVEVLEKKAQKSLVQVQAQVVGAANRFERAFSGASKQFKGVWSFATRSELQTLASKVEELNEKVEKLTRGERLRSAARKQEAA